MADLLKCMECGGMVSSEADKCPHCKTSRYGIRGVNCHVCGGLLKFSEARSTKRSYDDEKSYLFHDSCYQQVSQTVEKKKTINCPVCTQPNEFSYADKSNTWSRYYREERINCANCGHPYEYQRTKENDPYTDCQYCRFLLEKNLEVLFKDYAGHDRYAHKLCYTPQRQSENLQSVRNREDRDKKMAEETRLKKKKEADEKFESKLRGALLPGLFMGGISLAMGIWAILLFGILFGLYLIIDWE